MLTNISAASSRARPLTANTSAMRVIGPASAAAMRLRHRQQVRGFRFGLWSRQFDPEHHRELRRRHRAFKYRYMESIKRTLSWDQHPRAEDPKRALRRMMASYWEAGDPRPAGRFVNVDETTGSREDAPHARPGQNIEDVERGAMDSLFRSDKTAAYEYDLWQSPLQNIRNYLANQTSQTAETAGSARHAGCRPNSKSPSTKSEADVADGVAQKGGDSSYIDPITNRRVFRSADQLPETETVDVPVHTFKSYRSQFSPTAPLAFEDPQVPFHSDGPPPPDELRQYQHVKIDANPTDHIHWVDQTPAFSRAAGAQESEALYTDLDKHEAIADSKCTTLSNREPPKCDDHAKSTPSSFAGAQSAVDPASQYEDLGQYGHVGRVQEPKNISSKPYPDLGKYDAVGFQESVVLADEKPDYGSLIRYGPVAASVPWSMQDSPPKLDCLTKYKPHRWNEPDGLRPLSAEELSKYYNDLHMYGPVRWNEPDGLPPPIADEPTKQYTDVGKYTAVMYGEPDGKSPEQSAVAEQKDLSKHKPVLCQEPDGQPPQEPADAERAELGRYKPVVFQEPDGQPIQISLDAEHLELNKDSLELSQEPDNRPAPASGLAEAAETAQRSPVRDSGPDRLPSISQDPVAESLERLKSKAQTIEKSESSPSEEGWQSRIQPFFEADSLETGCLTANEIRAKLMDLQVRESPERQSLEADMDQMAAKWDSANAEAEAMLRESRQQETSQSQAAESGTITTERNFTGNYVRDFPEDFAASWNVTNSSGQDALLPSGQTKAQQDLNTEYEMSIQSRFPRAERDDVEASSFDEPFPESEQSGRLEPALDRQPWSSKPLSPRARKMAQVDPYSAEPQGLETSYAEERGRQDTRLVYIKTHGNFEPENASAAEADSLSRGQPDVAREPSDVTGTAISGGLASSPPTTHCQSEPTLYKILAYDPTMQIINTAETTSVVTDSATALTPAEVLLRLSNPSKFFPHFGPLQDEGYEIVSGSGDVLVFRKVREARVARPSTATAAADLPSASASPPPRVNPIDMMGSRPVLPNTGNFASPTGFVNYDFPAVDGAEGRSQQPLPPPPFRSMIDVRREEPVFSGPKTTAWAAQEPKSSKKRSLGRRMVGGAVWLAGISYAIGVVGEYFRTGGADGLGPKGF